jgi:hypothetical protein
MADAAAEPTGLSVRVADRLGACTARHNDRCTGLVREASGTITRRSPRSVRSMGRVSVMPVFTPCFQPSPSEDLVRPTLFSIRSTGLITDDALIALNREHDDGFDAQTFAEKHSRVAELLPSEAAV